MSEAAATATDEQQGETSIPELQDSPTLRAKIVEAHKRMAELNAQRTELNAQRQAVLEGLAAQGVPKEALKRALKDLELDEAQRDALDTAYQVVRAALGHPLQGDLFGAPIGTQH